MPPILPQRRRWLATQAVSAMRYDDIHLLSETIGWAVNSNGQILKTEDGAHWEQQAQFENIWLRCITMADHQIGWIGSMTGEVYHTTDGRTWQLVSNLPGNRPGAVCGLHALGDRKHVFAAGTNDPYQPTRFVCSSDGGEHWTCRSMDDQAELLVDIYFENEHEGWLVGGRSELPTTCREDVFAAVWHTVDGGATWREVVGEQVALPLGEWGWKIQLVDRDFIVVSLESYEAAAILISDDHGRTWCRREIRDDRGALINSSVEGTGFLDRQRGWVSGWGGNRGTHPGRTSMTEDSGRTWRDVTGEFPSPEVRASSDPILRGQYINRFRVVGDSVYASGNTIYKYTDCPILELATNDRATSPWLVPHDVLRATGGQVAFTIELPVGARRLHVAIYDRFAIKVRTVVDDDAPAPGTRKVIWDLADDRGRRLPGGTYGLRASYDGCSASRMILVESGDVDAVATASGGTAARPSSGFTMPYRLRGG